jgi:predicted lipoprotein with Yx(FWY)xxD motif
MKRLILGLAAGLFAVVAVAGTAFAMDPATYADSSLGKILVDPQGMTLYTFDKDKKGETMSACTGKCIAAWPPFVAPAGAQAMGAWTTVDVTDKDGKAEKMWAYDGMPLYYWVKDKKPGDVTGDGVGSVWHVVKQAM